MGLASSSARSLRGPHGFGKPPPKLRRLENLFRQLYSHVPKASARVLLLFGFAHRNNLDRNPRSPRLRFFQAAFWPLILRRLTFSSYLRVARLIRNMPLTLPDGLVQKALPIDGMTYFLLTLRFFGQGHFPFGKASLTVRLKLNHHAGDLRFPLL